MVTFLVRARVWISPHESLPANLKDICIFDVWKSSPTPQAQECVCVREIYISEI